MLDVGVTQSELSRMSGVRQPSISQFLTGRIEMSDDLLDRLLSCLGYRLEVSRRSVKPDLQRSEERSWKLHRRLSCSLDHSTLELWRPQKLRSLERLQQNVSGQPHLRNLDRWRDLVLRDDVLGVTRVLTGLDRESIEMREVSPMGGLITQEERSELLGLTG